MKNAFTFETERSPGQAKLLNISRGWSFGKSYKKHRGGWVLSDSNGHKRDACARQVR